MLHDSLGRRFHYLRLSITELCNFRCNYCLPDGNPCDTPKDNLSKDEIRTLVATFAKLGTSKVRITGGEPALRKDLPDIIEICKNTPGIKKVALTTNGFSLKRQIHDFKQAGLDALNVSADSLDPRMFAAITGKDTLEDIMQGIDMALGCGIQTVKLNTVMLKQFNLADMQQFFTFIKDTPVTWRFIELMQTGNNQQFFNQNHVAGDSLKNNLLAQGWQRVIAPKHAGPAQEFSHADYAGRIGLIMPYSKDFCQTCNRLRVSSQGKLHLCLFADQGLDIRHHLSANDIQGASTAISQLVAGKTAGHNLQQGFTGATQQLAMLGG
ncbi:molybdenum cofactor biosynthesis protein A [Paraglaciecola mesophila KMM 241]|uniref:GTP 3',8-cyclase n=1 Tax=Paraglaciecola mesophila KMM 241 TaxID=1128912 RepID=K6XUW4_9ALTE|nr:GTP 3',8-cyclase MoaA [Paraglaciecola mesophila]GAC24404.1 molybdenum cofactor biosynthesis protein A [Paraglaciecola mesophila KMM 241]